MMWIAKILGVDKWIVGVIAVLALLAAIGLGGWWIHSTIYDSGYQAASVKYEAQIAAEHAAAVTARNAEVERQAGVQAAAKSREASRIAEMQAETDSLEQKIKELEREADQDPDAGKPALGAPSVQRINKVR